VQAHRELQQATVLTVSRSIRIPAKARPILVVDHQEVSQWLLLQHHQPDIIVQALQAALPLRNTPTPTRQIGKATL
jgi:hypothetical protein